MNYIRKTKTALWKLIKDEIRADLYAQAEARVIDAILNGNPRKPIKSRTSELAKDIGDAFPDGYEPTSRKPIKPRTSKRAKEEAQYRKRKKEIFRIPRWCEACEKLFPADSVRMAEDIHHRRGRAYRLLNYEPEFVLVCRCCHKFIHDNPEDARHFGLLCEKGQWNKQPKD